MSKIFDLGNDDTAFPSMIQQYETDITEARTNRTITGKTLDLALREQGTWPAYYGERRAELKVLVKYFDTRCDAVRSRLIRQYNENYNPKLSERLLNAYVDGEAEYINIRKLHAVVDEMYEKYDNICEAFTVRGYALRDITTARVNNIHET